MDAKPQTIVNIRLQPTMKTPALTLSIAACLSACAGISPSDLKPVSVDRSMALESPVQYEEYYSIAGNRLFYTISPGRYAAKYEDANGIYYEGPPNCFTIRIESDSLKKDGRVQPAPTNYRCGIFMPVASTAEPKLYFYRDAALSEAVFSGSHVQLVDGKGAPLVSPAAGAGAGIGMGIVRALDAAELKNIHFYPDQPKPGQLISALR